MGLIDIAILVIIGAFLLKGLIRGLLKEVCSLLGLVLGGVFAFTLHPGLARLLQENFSIPAQLSVWGASLAIFLVVVIIFGVLGFVLSRFVKMVMLGGLNRLTGALFGVVQAVVVLSMVLVALGSQVAPDAVRQMMSASQLAPPFVTLGETLLLEGRELAGRQPGQ
ncbi:MAG: CvpA family protein [Pelovirga sp.]